MKNYSANEKKEDLRQTRHDWVMIVLAMVTAFGNFTSFIVTQIGIRESGIKLYESSIIPIVIAFLAQLCIALYIIALEYRFLVIRFDFSWISQSLKKIVWIVLSFSESPKLIHIKRVFSHNNYERKARFDRFVWLNSTSSMLILLPAAFVMFSIYMNMYGLVAKSDVLSEEKRLRKVELKHAISDLRSTLMDGVDSYKRYLSEGKKRIHDKGATWCYCECEDSINKYSLIHNNFTVLNTYLDGNSAINLFPEEINKLIRDRKFSDILEIDPLPSLVNEEPFDYFYSVERNLISSDYDGNDFEESYVESMDSQSPSMNQLLAEYQFLYKKYEVLVPSIHELKRFRNEPAYDFRQIGNRINVIVSSPTESNPNRKLNKCDYPPDESGNKVVEKIPNEFKSNDEINLSLINDEGHKNILATRSRMESLYAVASGDNNNKQLEYVEREQFNTFILENYKRSLLPHIIIAVLLDGVSILMLLMALRKYNTISEKLESMAKDHDEYMEYSKLRRKTTIQELSDDLYFMLYKRMHDKRKKDE